MNKLIIKDLTIKYSETILLDNCSCEISSGEVVLIEGKNGTGKTTLIKTILGIDRNMREIKGMISFSIINKNITEMNDSELLNLRSQIAYLEQKDNYDNNPFETVFDVLADSYKDYYKKNKLTLEDKQLIEKIFIKYKPIDSNFNFKTKVSKLSGGQQRLLSIISSICIRKESKLFIIDEPLNNLDVNTVVKVSNILNSIMKENKEAMFIIVSHCKIFPFITKVLEIKDNKLLSSSKNICHTCYGEPDEEGYYG